MCNYSNNCFINARTRKDCTKCRLQKCFDVGMRSEVIGSATSERHRKELFVELTKQSLDSSTTDSDDSYGLETRRVAPEVAALGVEAYRTPRPLSAEEREQMKEVREVAEALRRGQYVITEDTKVLRPVVEALRMQQVSCQLTRSELTPLDAERSSA